MKAADKVSAASLLECCILSSLFHRVVDLSLGSVRPGSLAWRQFCKCSRMRDRGACDGRLEAEDGARQGLSFQIAIAEARSHRGDEAAPKVGPAETNVGWPADGNGYPVRNLARRIEAQDLAAVDQGDPVSALDIHRRAVGAAAFASVKDATVGNLSGLRGKVMRPDDGSLRMTVGEEKRVSVRGHGQAVLG